MIRRINLLPEELRAVNKSSFYLLSVVIAVCYIFFLYSVNRFQAMNISNLETRKNALSSQASALNTTVNKFNAEREKIKSIENRERELLAKTAIIRTISENKTPWANMLHLISDFVPSGVWLTDLSSAGTTNGETKLRGFKLTGMATSSTLITDFMTALDSSPFLEGVTLNHAKKTEYQGSEVFSFEIMCKVTRASR